MLYCAWYSSWSIFLRHGLTGGLCPLWNIGMSKPHQNLQRLSFPTKTDTRPSLKTSRLQTVLFNVSTGYASSSPLTVLLYKCNYWWSQFPNPSSWHCYGHCYRWSRTVLYPPYWKMSSVLYLVIVCYMQTQHIGCYFSYLRFWLPVKSMPLWLAKQSKLRCTLYIVSIILYAACSFWTLT